MREYFEAQRAIVEAGLRTTATMVIGFDETLEERLEHLQRTRDFQDETGGLFSFLCWTYKPYGTAFGGREISAEEYRRWIALSRIFLDNVKHVRTSVLTQNEDAFRALDFGADDFGLPIEDEVTQKAGRRSSSTSTALLAVPPKARLPRQCRRRTAAALVSSTRACAAPAGPSILSVHARAADELCESRRRSRRPPNRRRGAADLVLVSTWFSHVEARWDFPRPPLTTTSMRLASFKWLISFDKQGIGLSDPVARPAAAPRGWMTDVRAVMDAAAVERAVVMGANEEAR